METPAPAPNETETQKEQRKSQLLLAVSQLDMLLQLFGESPERVQKSTAEFREALNEWASS